jgi:hypothetical protein
MPTASRTNSLNRANQQLNPCRFALGSSSTTNTTTTTTTTTTTCNQHDAQDLAQGHFFCKVCHCRQHSAGASASFFKTTTVPSPTGTAEKKRIKTTDYCTSYCCHCYCFAAGITMRASALCKSERALFATIATFIYIYIYNSIDFLRTSTTTSVRMLFRMLENMSVSSHHQPITASYCTHVPAALLVVFYNNSSIKTTKQASQEWYRLAHQKLPHHGNFNPTCIKTSKQANKQR